MASNTTTFTVRISLQDYDQLTSSAAMLHVNTAKLARTIMSEGIQQRLNPDAIDRRMEAERARLQDAASTIRQRAQARAADDADPGICASKAQDSL